MGASDPCEQLGFHRPGLVGADCQNVSMGGHKPLRKIRDPVVAAAPAGVRIRTRIHISVDEAEALSVIGLFLGGLFRAELASRIRCGALDRKRRAARRLRRKQAITAVSSSRWAGSITRAVEDQYQLGMRSLAAHVSQLRRAVRVLQERCALRPGQTAPVTAGVEAVGRARLRPRGYGTAAERFQKTRRLAALRAKLSAAEKALSAGSPSLVMGGRRLWRNRHHLDAAHITEGQWRDRWDAARMFLTADGETGKAGGNETIRVDQTGILRVKVPTALVERFGTHVVIGEPVRFAHRGGEWAGRVAARQAVRYDISYNPDSGRWYLDASWKTVTAPAASLDELRGSRVLGIDLNADHLAVCVLDKSGNPVGDPSTIQIATAGLAASRRDARIRSAITTLLNLAEQERCAAVVIENLDFADARATGREVLGRGGRGKRFRRAVAGIPTAKFRTRLTGMAARRGISVIGVDAAYTSQWGDQHWKSPLQQQTSVPVTRHHAAATAIGRRGLGLRIRRHPAGPRSGQRTAAGTPPGRARPHPNHVGRHGSSGPPTRTRCAPVHRITPARRGQHRSDRTRAELTRLSTGTVFGSWTSCSG